MSATEAIWREIMASEEQLRPIAHIRLTTDAILGSPVLVPLTPERARQVRLLAVPVREGIAVVADPEIIDRYMEIVVHPGDWFAVLRETPGWVGSMHAGEFMGIKVLG